MQFSVHWIGEYVDLSGVSASELGELLTVHMAEVDGVQEPKEWQGIRVARVIGLRPHPNADKLRLVTLNDGSIETEVVCGAPNVAEGQHICFAPEGTVLPDGLVLERRAIRGVESAGMVLSERELGLSDEHEGILVLEPETEVGTPVKDVLPSGPVIEVDNNGITTRPDLWGHYGAAREVATILQRELKSLDLGPELPTDAPAVAVDITAPDLCRRYLGWAIRGVRVEPSPAWLRNRIEEAGQRSINNIVDLTNYILLECGQPIHAFDRSQIAGGKIEVRTSVEGESVVTLDGTERKLPANCCVIADGERAVAVAGIMGLANSEVTEGTTEIILEVANFDMVAVRRAAQSLGLRTESAIRFEKGIDPHGVPVAARRFFHLLKQLCPDATIDGGPNDACLELEPQREITMSADFISKRLGIPIDDSRVDEILGRLGFEVSRSGDQLQVRVPTWRAGRDVSIPEDLVEEVGRIHGYDKIAPEALVGAQEPLEAEQERTARAQVRAALSTQCGLTEMYAYPFTTAEACRKAAIEPGTLRLANAEQEGLDLMVTSQVPRTLEAVASNLRYRDDVAIYVVQPVFEARDGELPNEREFVTLGIASKSNESTVFEVKGAVEALLSELHVSGVRIRQEAGPEWLHPGRSACLARGKEVFGWFGEIHPAVARAFDIEAPTAIADLDLSALRNARGRGSRMKPISRYQSSTYDVAVVVDRKTAVEDVGAILERVDKKLVQGVRLFDVYEGKGVPEGKKSVAFTITFGSPKKTLDSTDLERLHDATNKAIEKKGWSLRG